jgi:hypothetical protein
MIEPVEQPRTASMTTASKKKTTAKRTPMARFARQIASGNHGDECLALPLPSGKLCVGDPITEAPAIALGVPSCDVFLWSFEDGDEDDAVIAVRVRKTLAVRWQDAPSGGVDSGVFGVWDESSLRDEAAALPEGTLAGAERIQGRVVFAISTGDGCFDCVAGYDEAGELCALVAGPGVRAEKFGVAAPVDPESVLPPVDTSTCPVVAPFRDALLEGAPSAERAAIEAALAPFAGSFAAIDEKRKAKARTRKRGVVLLHWAIACWSKLLAEVMPEASRELASVTGPAVGKLEWALPIAKIFDYRMSDRRFDLRQALGEDAVAAALRELDADLPRQLGLLGLAAAWERIDPKDAALRDALWYARAGMQGALELRAIHTRAAEWPAGLEAPLAALMRALK